MATTATQASPFVSSAHKTTSSTPTSVSYETFAPRSTEQIARLSRIAALTAGPWAIASNAQSNDVDDTKTLSRNAVSEAMLPPSLDPTEATNAILQKDDLVHQAWNEAMVATSQWSHQVKHTTSLRLALRASINIAQDLSHRHAELLRHSGELSAAADRLQEEARLLDQHAQEIGRPLQHYDAVDRIGILVGVLFKGKTTVRGLAKLKVDHDEYPQVLEEIDQAVSFFGNESGGKEALDEEMKRRKSHPNEMLSGNIEYYRRALVLQEAALDLIKEAVAERIQNTTSQIIAALNTNKNPVSADQLEASLIFTRFHGISLRSHRLISLVKDRLSRGDIYHEVLQLCRQTYCASRESLLRLTVQAHMEKLQQQHGPVGMTRLASVFLIRLCTLETSLYLDFFGDKKDDDESKPSGNTAMASQVMADDGTFYDSDFQSYLTQLCSALHRTARRSLVTMLDLDTLCQIVSVLREERSLASSSPTTMAAARAIASVIQDAQERLIFCANNSLTKEVMRFKPSAADLNYPEKLVAKKDVTTEETVAEDEEAMEKQLERVYESWFPPTRSVLRILSKIFRVVEPKVFEDLALTAVQACTSCLKIGATMIAKRQSQRDADLFLVKHLLILREQLSPFDIELRSVERQLDFSEAGKAVARFLANRNRRLFAISTENALLTLLREGVSVQESSVDSKRDLEDALRSACNDFIEHTVDSVAGPFLAKLEELQSSDSNDSKAPDFMKADLLEELLNKTLENMEKSMEEVTTQMSLYLDNPATQNILLKPVIRKVSRGTEEVRKFVQKQGDGENDYNADKRQVILDLLDQIDQKIKRTAKANK